MQPPSTSPAAAGFQPVDDRPPPPAASVLVPSLPAASVLVPSLPAASVLVPSLPAASVLVPSLPAASVLVEDRQWRRLVPGAERLAARAAAAAGGAGTIVLSSDRTVKALNARHRHRNKPTNVLTFEPLAGADRGGGEIVLALGTVRREAAAARRLPAHHLAHLVVHGVLHLRGLDHHHVGDARRMEMAETRILHRLGVPNPWRQTSQGSACF